ncbi:MAG TPA: LacI family DNA-binding transcriptional regulator [Spirochaetia bacterium]
MAVTIKDIARICGVSVGTVDRALRNRAGISPQTRAHVLATAEKHGYKPNIVARSLKVRRTFEIGLIVHDLENEFFAQLVNAVQEIAWKKGFFIQVAVSRREPGRERLALEHMAGRNVDGIILFPTCIEPDFDGFLRGLDRPVVTIANRVSPRWPFVGLRDRAVLHEVTEGIVARGYRRLFFVGPFDELGGKINIYQIDERYAGFREVVARHRGVEGFLLGGPDYVARLREVRLEETRTAVICASDIFALEILRDLRLRGVRVPRDIGLMGFDSIDALRYIEPQLSTVEYPIQRMGEIAFSLLTEPREGTEVPYVELSPRVVWGESLEGSPTP